MIRWLSLGRPRYPGQVNPDVPMVSDIAAHTFQPVFIAGSAATGVCFLGTVFAVHHVRYSPKFYGLTDDARWRQAVSLVALVTGLAAAVSLVCLGIFDTYEAHLRHRYLLMGAFGGLLVSAIMTTVVWWDQAWGPVVFVGLRKWYGSFKRMKNINRLLTFPRCIFNVSLVFLQFAVGLSFVTLMYSGHYHASGILEWCLTYLGSIWLLSFIGYIR
jgi:hypothetical protein